MIDFKQIEYSDRDTICQHLDGNTYRACDFSFSNLLAWEAKFETKYAIIENTLFLRFSETDNEFYYMMPIGPMNIADAIKIIEKDALENNIPFQMKGISHDMWEIINNAIPNKYEYLHDRNNDEYIYLSEKLISLSGKKLQSKRNHINRFKADNPNWEYVTIKTAEDLKECKEMLDIWTADKNDISMKYDYISASIMIDNFDYLRLKGGAIKIDGKMIAFTIGAKLTEDCFVVHVEKAFGDINGAYTIINQQFIEHEASNFTYINREEDMGLESLRKAKKSYYPVILLEEGYVKPLSEIKD